jgi:hypothetical protein
MRVGELSRLLQCYPPDHVVLIRAGEFAQLSSVLPVGLAVISRFGAPNDICVNGNENAFPNAVLLISDQVGQPESRSDIYAKGTAS